MNIDSLTTELHEALTAEAEAWAALEEAKLCCIDQEAESDHAIRVEAIECGEKMTEAMVAKRIDQAPAVIAARRLVIKCELHYRLMKADVAQAEAVVSLHKADCYRQAGRVA